MTFKAWIIALCAAAIAHGQPLTAMPEEKAPFDSSEIIADKIVKSEVPVLVDFWATWCMPCRMLTPTIEDLKKKYNGKLKVIKINVDVHRKIAAYFRVTSIPAVFFIRDKAVVYALAGLRPKEDYEQAIAEVIKMKVPPQADTKEKREPQSPPVAKPVQ
jgi:thioredoxin